MACAWVSAAVMSIAHCGTDGAGAGPIGLASTPGVAGELSPKLEAILIGEEQRCREDERCASGVCYYGSCQGLMVLDQPWMRGRALEAMHAALEETPSQRPVVTRHLRFQVGRKRLDYSQRARAVAGLEALGDIDGLLDVYETLPEPTQEAASMALTRLGAAAGVLHTVALTEDVRAPIAVEAVRALGVGGHNGQLPVLLSLLGQDVDQTLVRAAIDSLAALKDRRSVRPIVAFFDKAPEHLVRRMVLALQAIAETQVPVSPEAWVAWVEENGPPAAPEFVVRQSSSAEDIGLSDP